MNRRYSLSLSLTIISILTIQVSTGYSLPRYALRHADVSCMGCHVDPAGGGLRGKGGEAFEKEGLPMWKTDGPFSGQLSDNIRMGLDYRSQALFFQDITSTTDSGKTVTNTMQLKTLQAMALPIYLSAQLTPSINFYARYDFFTPSAFQAEAQFHFVHSSGEFWKANDVVNDAYIKAGAFMPNFGERFDDHTIYTRGGDGSISQFGQDGLFWKPSYKDLGAELGVTLFDHFNFTAGYFEGLEYRQSNQVADFDTTNRMALALRGVVATEIVPDVASVEVGGSYYYHPHAFALLNGGTNSVNLSLTAVHGGIHIGPAAIIGEINFGKNVPTQSSGILAKTNALALEGTCDIVHGLTALLRYETYQDKDTNDVVGTKVKDRIVVGLQWFPVRFIEFRPEFRVADLTDATGGGAPTTHTETTMLLQTHIFF